MWRSPGTTMTSKKKKKKKSKSNGHATTRDVRQAAFDETSEARAALSPDALLTINVDAQVAFTTVIAALPRLRALRDSLAKLPDFDLEQFDRIETYAMAFDHANTLFLAASEPDDALPALGQRASEIRGLLLSDATALARRGLFDARPLANLKGGSGYLNVASDVAVLVQMFRERWDHIASKTAVEAAELDEAEAVSLRVKIAFAERRYRKAHAVAAADEKQRAYTLLVDAYDQARRAATYVRWAQGDADELVPSLWAGRGGRGKAHGAPVPLQAPETPAAPPPNDGTTPASPPPAPPATNAPTACLAWMLPRRRARRRLTARRAAGARPRRGARTRPRAP